jgi:hypothetical protein
VFLLTESWARDPIEVTRCKCVEYVDLRARAIDLAII